MNLRAININIIGNYIFNKIMFNNIILLPNEILITFKKNIGKDHSL